MSFRYLRDRRGRSGANSVRVVGLVSSYAQENAKQHENSEKISRFIVPLRSLLLTFCEPRLWLQSGWDEATLRHGSDRDAGKLGYPQIDANAVTA